MGLRAARMEDDSERSPVLTFVCTGNTCRSPMAEAIARQVIAAAGISDFRVCSAGTHAQAGQQASEGAIRAARARGLDLTSHRATPLSREVVAASDLLVCMERVHLQRIGELGGGARGQLLTAMARTEGDIADPFGGDQDVYNAAFVEIEDLVRRALGGAVAAAEAEAAAKE